MLVAAFLRNGLAVVVPLAIACTVYLYFYPIFNGCGFPVQSRDPIEAFAETKKLHWPNVGTDKSVPTKLAPFRLLALGDPQLEGDTSLPTYWLGTFPHLKSLYKHVTFQTELWSFRERIRQIVHDVVDIVLEDIPFIFESGRKRFDHVGNDFYLGHIYRTLHWWTQPTHVSVLGDLLGSQWIDDDEFERRGHRFWNRTFKGGERVPDELALWPDREYDVTGVLDGSPAEQIWTKRILNVAGNHDIGYAGDLTKERVARFERLFGKVNYNLHFELPISDPVINATIRDPETNPDSTRLIPEIRIVILNDMNLDTPAKEPTLQDETYNFINTIIGTSSAVEYEGHFTLLLTHIPLYKPGGVCVDAPFFDFHTAEDGGGVKEQYLLSFDASKGILEGIFGIAWNPDAPGKGLGRKGLVVNGHDHAGCDTYHYVNQTNGTEAFDRPWQVRTWTDALQDNVTTADGIPGRREITVRSMMGGFGGNAGLLSMWFNEDTWNWEYEYVECPLGTQHFWWFTHFLDIGILIAIGAYGAITVLERQGIDVDGQLFIYVSWVREWIKKAKERRTRKTLKDVCGQCGKMSQSTKG